MHRTSLVVLVLGTLTAQDWRPAYPVTSPGNRVGARMVHDAARNELVLFGGLLSPYVSNETWTWNGTDWTQKFPATSPLGRAYHGMCYDATRQRVVLYGGQSGATPLNDTWEWDGTNWTQMAPATSPPLRYYPVITYTGTRTLLFGGNSAGGPLADTWTWNGTNWAQLSPATTPPGRYYHSMSGQGGGQAVMFGGFAPSIGTGYLSDTWTWTGTDWAQATPSSAPAGRANPAMVWDAANSRHLLFGGSYGIGPYFEDTWTFAGGQWTQLATQRSPSPRGSGGAAWFAPQNRFVVYAPGGISDLRGMPMWEFGQSLASFVPFGPSQCPFPDPPVLRAHQSQPRLGTTFTARVESVGAVLTSVALGLSNTAWAGGSLPFDLVAVGTNPNCLLRVSPDLLLYLGFGQSETWTLPIPNNPALVGYAMHAQGFTWGLGTFPLNISLANAATLVVDANQPRGGSASGRLRLIPADAAAWQPSGPGRRCGPKAPRRCDRRSGQSSPAGRSCRCGRSGRGLHHPCAARLQGVRCRSR